MPYCQNGIFCSICCLYQRSTRTYYCGYEHNCPKVNNQSQTPVGLIIGLTVGGSVLLICIIIVYFVWKHRQGQMTGQVVSMNNVNNTLQDFNHQRRQKTNDPNQISMINYNPTQPDFAIPSYNKKVLYDPTNPAQANLQSAHPQPSYFQQPPPYNMRSTFFNS